MLLNRSTTLASGRRVHLRLPHGSDRLALRALLARLGQVVDDRHVAVLVAHHPRRRAVVCALAWTPEGQTVLGLAAGDVGADGPDLLLVDAEAGDELTFLLAAALAERTGPSMGRGAGAA